MNNEKQTQKQAAETHGNFLANRWTIHLEEIMHDAYKPVIIVISIADVQWITHVVGLQKYERKTQKSIIH